MGSGLGCLAAHWLPTGWRPPSGQSRRPGAEWSPVWGWSRELTGTDWDRRGLLGPPVNHRLTVGAGGGTATPAQPAHAPGGPVPSLPPGGAVWVEALDGNWPPDSLNSPGRFGRRGDATGGPWRTCWPLGGSWEWARRYVRTRVPTAAQVFCFRSANSGLLRSSASASIPIPVSRHLWTCRSAAVPLLQVLAAMNGLSALRCFAVRCSCQQVPPKLMAINKRESSIRHSVHSQAGSLMRVSESVLLS